MFKVSQEMEALIERQPPSLPFLFSRNYFHHFLLRKPAQKLIKLPVIAEKKWV